MRQKLLATSLLFAFAVVGCRVDQNKSGDGENVKVATPFGGLQVKTDSTDVIHGLGIPTYPGATMIQKDRINGRENGSADVDMSFGSFQLRVKAVEFHTADTSQKVLDFYRKALGRYGDVLQCEDNHPVGTPTRTREGLTCEEHEGKASGIHTATINSNGISTSSYPAKVELKAGSKQHQHIVSINPDGTGTNFGLVSLDLPGDFHFGDSKDDDKDSSK